MDNRVRPFKVYDSVTKKNSYWLTPDRYDEIAELTGRSVEELKARYEDLKSRLPNYETYVSEKDTNV